MLQALICAKWQSRLVKAKITVKQHVLTNANAPQTSRFLPSFLLLLRLLQNVNQMEFMSVCLRALWLFSAL